ncbi:MAG: cupin domain-containing protein [Rhodospirillales bacterium]|jgi:quercetin dioxygenase-like cupin family protein|nr:cupin domain-containing protein [Rhodospirillales bacterium]
MPFYKAQDMQATPDVVNPNVMMMQFGGEFIKVGIVTYEAGEAPPPHSHPNDEQWIYMLEGRLAHLLDDEIVTVGPGDLVHIPRNTVHGIRLLESPCRFFTCKSPAGSGNLSEDYTEVPNVTELEQRLAEVS